MKAADVQVAKKKAGLLFVDEPKRATQGSENIAF